MKVTYNDAPIAESDEDKPGVILNYAEDGSIVGMEILDASNCAVRTGHILPTLSVQPLSTQSLVYSRGNGSG